MIRFIRTVRNDPSAGSTCQSGEGTEKLRIGGEQMKAVFLDYTGTMVREDDPYTRELLGYFLSHSDLKRPEDALAAVWGKLKEYEDQCTGERFIKKDEMADRILAWCVENCGLKGDLAYMHDTWRKIWIHAPLFEDVKPFFDRVGCPVYVVTNDDLCYIEESLKEKGLRPAGIAAAEMVRACKPHREIFDLALSMAGVPAEDVIHIGDSMTSDVKAAQAAGITPVYLSRTKDVKIEGVRVIRSLLEMIPTEHSS